MEFFKQPAIEPLPTRPSVIMFARNLMPTEDMVASALAQAGITKQDLEKFKPKILSAINTEQKPENEVLVPAINTKKKSKNHKITKGSSKKAAVVEVNGTTNNAESKPDNNKAIDEEDISEDESFLVRQYKGSVIKDLDLVNPKEGMS